MISFDKFNAKLSIKIENRKILRGFSNLSPKSRIIIFKEFLEKKSDPNSQYSWRNVDF